VLLPMPDEAPVTTIVLPPRRFAIAVAIVSFLMHDWSKIGEGLSKSAGSLGSTARVRKVLWKSIRDRLIIEGGVQHDELGSCALERRKDASMISS